MAGANEQQYDGSAYVGRYGPSPYVGRYGRVALSPTMQAVAAQNATGGGVAAPTPGAAANGAGGGGGGPSPASVSVPNNGGTAPPAVVSDPNIQQPQTTPPGDGSVPPWLLPAAGLGVAGVGGYALYRALLARGAQPGATPSAATVAPSEAELAQSREIVPYRQGEMVPVGSGSVAGQSAATNNAQRAIEGPSNDTPQLTFRSNVPAKTRQQLETEFAYQQRDIQNRPKNATTNAVRDNKRARFAAQAAAMGNAATGYRPAQPGNVIDPNAIRMPDETSGPTITPRNANPTPSALQRARAEQIIRDAEAALRAIHR